MAKQTLLNWTPPPDMNINSIPPGSDSAEILQLQAENAELRRQIWRAQIVRETGLDPDLGEFLDAPTEQEMRDQAASLIRAMPSAGGAEAGQTKRSEPVGQTGPTIDEQIAAAEKAGNRNLSIRLRRQKAGLVGS